MSHEPHTPLVSRARNAVGILALAVGLVVFYLVGLTVWSVLGDPTGTELLVAFLATGLAGNLIARRRGLV